MHSKHAMPWVLSTDCHTSNLVDVNWTITVIIKFQVPLVVDNIGVFNAERGIWRCPPRRRTFLATKIYAIYANFIIFF